MENTTDPMDDAALFQAALAPAPPADAKPAPETTANTGQPGTAETPGQPRDDHGRFAAKPADTTTTPQAPSSPPAEQPDAAAQAIPPWRMAEVTQERNDLRSRLDQATQQNAAFAHQLRQMQERIAQFETTRAPAPDFYENPSGATAAAIEGYVNPHLTAISRNMVHNSRLSASAVHGVDTVQKADDAFTQAYHSGQLDPADYHRVMNSPNIYDAAVGWWKRTEMQNRVGGDFDGFLKKHEDSLMNDPAFRQRFAERLRTEAANPSNGQRPGNPVVLPPSLGRTPASAGNAPEALGGIDDASLFAYATAKK